MRTYADRDAKFWRQAWQAAFTVALFKIFFKGGSNSFLNSSPFPTWAKPRTCGFPPSRRENLHRIHCWSSWVCVFMCVCVCVCVHSMEHTRGVLKWSSKALCACLRPQVGRKVLSHSQLQVLILSTHGVTRPIAGKLEPILQSVWWPPRQSWALPVFFHFFNNKKWFFCTFYQANNLFLHQSYLKSPLILKINLIKNAKNHF